MPYKQPPKCVQCEKTESILWRNLELGVFCQECFEKNESQEKTEKTEPDSEETNTKTNRKATRSTRAGKSNSSVPKGKGRRCIFKKTPFKTPTITATTYTSDTIFYNNMYMQKGDIVALVDSKDQTYYAQVRGFLTDTYLQKSAFLTWLIPSKFSPDPNEQFDPCTYLIGPEEDIPRKLSSMEFVMHAPSDYYMTKDTPYPSVTRNKGISSKEHTNYIWTNLPTV
ncbi:GATA zinc finger domain-containing protein 1 [Culicoides brevitarsis]|uniref:GATA zinc finger domain-containing protein 1 n=1 Tax=Culicoides brevitarsis TaxID=469753 RepID=UPI00307B44FE